MKIIQAANQYFGFSTLDSGRHWVCMSCFDPKKDTLTPLLEYEDGDHEPDGDSLCKECSERETIQRRSGLERWIALYPEQINEAWKGTK